MMKRVPGRVGVHGTKIQRNDSETKGRRAYIRDQRKGVGRESKVEIIHLFCGKEASGVWKSSYLMAPIFSVKLLPVRGAVTGS